MDRINLNAPPCVVTYLVPGDAVVEGMRDAGQTLQAAVINVQQAQAISAAALTYVVPETQDALPGIADAAVDLRCRPANRVSLGRLNATSLEYHPGDGVSAAASTSNSVPAATPSGARSYAGLRENAQGFLERTDLRELFYIAQWHGQPMAHQTGIQQDPWWSGITPMLAGPVTRGYLTLAAASRQASVAGRRYCVYRIDTRSLTAASFNDNRDLNARFNELMPALTAEATIFPDPAHQTAYRKDLLRLAEHEVHLSLCGLGRERIQFMGDILVSHLWRGVDGTTCTVTAAPL